MRDTPKITSPILNTSLTRYHTSGSPSLMAYTCVQSATESGSADETHSQLSALSSVTALVPNSQAYLVNSGSLSSPRELL